MESGGAEVTGRGGVSTFAYFDYVMRTSRRKAKSAAGTPPAWTWTIPAKREVLDSLK